MDILLQDVQDRLLSQVAELKYVDENWGQLDDYSPNHPTKWPCALIDCFGANFENLGNLRQTGLATIQVVVGDVKTSNSSGAAPAQQKANSARFHVLMKKIYKALHGWAGSDHYTHLIRINQRRVQRDDGVRVHEMNFTVMITDASATPAKVKFAPGTFGAKIETV